jgi:hypothetical protein
MDIVDDLRELNSMHTPKEVSSIGERAADEIERLEQEIERLRGALRTIDSLVPKTEEIADFPYWMAIVGDIAEGALNGTWPAYGVMPALAKETIKGESK